jgi:hypothetical protein
MEHLFHNKPNYSFLKTFVCTCWPNLRPYNTHKLAFRSMRCVFLGYSSQHKGYKCLEPTNGRVYISHDVVFDETVFPFSKFHSNAGAQLRSEIHLLPPSLLNPCGSPGVQITDMGNIANPNPDAPVVAEEFVSPGTQVGDHMEEAVENVAHPMDLPVTMNPGSNPRADSLVGIVGASNTNPGVDPGPVLTAAGAPVGSGLHTDLDVDLGHVLTVTGVPVLHVENLSGRARSSVAPRSSVSNAAPASSAIPVQGSSAPSDPVVVPSSIGDSRPHTRLQSNICKPKTYTYGTVHYACLDDSGEPENLLEALKHEKWKSVMDEEYQALLNNKTWHLVPRHKANNIIDCHWVYKIKKKSDGSIKRYKARLVAKGFKQRQCIDYEDTF